MRLPLPENHTRDYERVIQMLERSLDETVSLSETDFRAYVQDDWDWKRAFLTSSAQYSPDAARALQADPGTGLQANGARCPWLHSNPTHGSSDKSPDQRWAALRVSLTEFVLLLRPSSPERLPAGVLAKTYTNKPLVHIDGEDLFGELALLRLLQKDAWDGVWVDTFHGNGREALFWTAMPHRSVSIQLEPSSAGRHIYDRIKDHRYGRIGGFFDILAWRGEELIFIEYKGPSDSANENEPSFLEGSAVGREYLPVSCFTSRRLQTRNKAP